MEVIFSILAIIVLLLIVNLKNSITAKFNILQQKIDALLDELKRSRKEQLPLQEAEKKSILEEEIFPHSAPTIRPAVEKEKEELKVPEIKKEEIKKPPETITYPNVISAPSSHQPIRPPVVQPPRTKKPGFFERNPDLEKFIGENLANKIGIGILVLGIGFFVKYAIDQNWINEIGRVCIGIACGGILLGIAHRMRNTFTGFSSVLVGGGIAILYLTIAIAFHEYELFNQTAAFMLMLIITAFTVILSVGYDRMELAILSILGGFASPFMVSTGEGNYIVLFTYILILDGGMLTLAYYKKWNPVNIICYVFTILIFGSWLGSKFDGENASMIVGAIIYATLFYLVFFAMNIVNNIKEKTTFKAIEISMLLSNTFFYYTAGMVALNNVYGEDFRGLFTAGLGIFNFIFAYSLNKNVRVDKNLVFLLIGLVLTFISLAAPVQLEGNYITLFWAAETVLLLWLSQKSGIRLIKLASVVIMVLMVISLVMDWEQIYFYNNSDQAIRIIFNKGYITSLFALASIVGTFYLLKQEDSEDRKYIQLYKTMLTLAGVGLLYVSQLLELRHHLFAYGVDYTAQNIIIGSYNMAFILGLLLAEKKLIIPEVAEKAFAFWGALAILLYLFFYHQEIIITRNDFLSSLAKSTGFFFHYVLVVLLLIVTALSLKKMQGLREFNIQTYNLYSWFYIFFFVFIASAELDHIVLLSAYTSDESIGHILTQNHKIGFPILWGMTSFVLIAIGLKLKKKHLRVISLTLFLITLLKLFIVDIRGISEGGKIAAFISLGILLLIVSFMYQRLKKLLLADEIAIEKKNEV